jgi:hypothetical protein
MPKEIQVKQKVKITGNVKITKRVAGEITEIKEYKNIITSAAFAAMGSFLIGSPGAGITYLAIGTGTGTPATTDVALGTETFRKILTTRTTTGAAATFGLFLDTTEGNGTIREIGLFGEAATVAPGSGTLYERCAINETKVITETYTIEVTFNFYNG